jgi:RNA polymerase sigma-70 factor, ECF subfamily
MMADALSLGALLSASLPLRAVPAVEEDVQLIDRIKRGDRRAFDQLFRRHADDVFRRLTRLIGPDPEREDLVQEVFVAAFRGIDRFRGEAAFSTWLYRVVVNVAYGHLRKRRRAPAELEAAIDAELAICGEASPEAAAAQREELVRALDFLDRLKPKKRIAFVLRVVEGMSLEEIGKIVDARPAAVGQRVRHAKRELDAMIAKEQKREAQREIRR